MTETPTDPCDPGGDTPLEVVLRATVTALQGVVGVGSAAPCGLADDGLLAGLAGLAGVEELGRLVDGLRVSFAAEVDDRSTASYGGEGLAGRLNFTSATELIAAVTSVSKQTARRRVRVGRQTRPSVSVTGAAIPARFDQVGQALRDGVIGVDAAESIIRPLGDTARTGGRGFTDELLAAEQQLVGQAQQQVGGFGFTADQVYQLAVRAAAHVDPDGAEPRYTDLVQERGMVFTKMRSGNTRMTAVLTPEQAGVWKAIDLAITSPRITDTFTPPSDNAHESTETVTGVKVTAATATSSADEADGGHAEAAAVDGAAWDALVASRGCHHDTERRPRTRPPPQQNPKILHPRPEPGPRHPRRRLRVERLRPTTLVLRITPRHRPRFTDGR